MITVRQIINNWGGAVKLATALGLPIQTVYSWINRDTVPARRVLDIARLTGVARHKLRPDIYPPPKRRRRA